MKLKNFLIAGAVAFSLSSCMISQSYQVTGAPIGNKEGVAKSKIIGNSDFSIKKAAENGNITEIGAVQHTYKTFLIFPIYTTRVYGN